MREPPDPPAGTVELLARRAGVEGGEPWLFWRRPRGWGWGWISWAQVADRAARAGRTLRELPRASPVAFDPAGVGGPALELALRAAGLLPVPVPSGEPLPAPCRGRLAAAPAEEGELALPAPRSRLEPWTPKPLAPDPERPPTAAAVVLDAGGYRSLAEPELIAAAAALDEGLPPLRRRPVFLGAADLRGTAGRLLHTWTLCRGAARAFAEGAEDLVAAALEVRPHLVEAGAGELALLAATLEASRRLRRWSRLRAVWVRPDEREEAAPWVWERLGVRCLSLPELGEIRGEPWPGGAADSQ